jgi:glycosyltransferase involved in cell wall biosynthesis
LSSQPPASERPFISLSVLAYNEVDTIERAARLCSEVLESLDRSYELVLVDDGSTDGCRERIITLAPELPGCRAILHPRNLGIGAGIRTCFFGTRGQWATWFPSDLQADPRELPRLVEHLAECEVLVTYRNPSERAEGPLRQAISSVDRALTKLLFGVSLLDLHWVRFFHRSVLERMRLSCRSPFVDTEMIIHALGQDARLIEAPLDDRPRSHGEAHGVSLHHLATSARDLIVTKLRGVKMAPAGEPGTLPAHEDPYWISPK